MGTPSSPGEHPPVPIQGCRAGHRQVLPLADARSLGKVLPRTQPGSNANDTLITVTACTAAFAPESELL